MLLGKQLNPNACGQRRERDGEAREAQEAAESARAGREAHTARLQALVGDNEAHEQAVQDVASRRQV